MTLFKLIAATYVITLVLAAGSIFNRPRTWLIERTPWLKPDRRTAHFLQCRLCLGFWVACVAGTMAGVGVVDILAVYGASYFLAMLERG